MPRARKMASERTALYRHFDAEGVLLYVGISRSAAARLASHEQSNWDQQIARVDVQWFENRAAALRAERKAIATEKPRHNKSAGQRNETPLRGGGLKVSADFTTVEEITLHEVPDASRGLPIAKVERDGEGVTFVSPSIFWTGTLPDETVVDFIFRGMSRRPITCAAVWNHLRDHVDSKTGQITTDPQEVAKALEIDPPILREILAELWRGNILTIARVHGTPRFWIRSSFGKDGEVGPIDLAALEELLAEAA